MLTFLRASFFLRQLQITTKTLVPAWLPLWQLLRSAGIFHYCIHTETWLCVMCLCLPLTPLPTETESQSYTVPNWGSVGFRCHLLFHQVIPHCYWLSDQSVALFSLVTFSFSRQVNIANTRAVRNVFNSDFPPLTLSMYQNDMLWKRLSGVKVKQHIPSYCWSHEPF